MDMKTYLREKYASVKVLEGQKKLKQDQQANKKKKRKAKQQPAVVATGGLKIIDEDAPWHNRGSDEEEDAPALVNDAEVTKMLRMEEMRQEPSRSGWVEVVSPSRASAPDGSPRRARHSSPDMSPPRTRHSSPDLSPPRTARHSSPDLSPARESKDISPPGNRHSSPDLSPPRTRHSSPDLSPPRARAHSSPDLSPPRTRHSSPDLSPPRTGRSLPDPDLSPVRRRGTKLSPPRSPGPQAKRRRLSPPGDSSPPRRSKVRELSPPRRSEGRDLSPPRRNRAEKDLSPPRRPSARVKGGLQNASELRVELEQERERQKKKLMQLDSSVTGKGAETQYRKNGKVVTVEELRKQKAEEQAKPEEKALEWGKGLVQKRQAEAMEQELFKELQKPFARSKDDPDLDKYLRNRVLWGDPMAHLVKKDDNLYEDFSRDEAMKESGFNIPQEIPKHSWLKRRVAPPANRYDIRPGRHWDGVDRSNGFEKQMFQKQNEKKAIQEHAYRWSVADM